MKKRIFCLITLLLTMATQGAWAEWTGGTYTASANETLGSITVSSDAMLIINDGVTVTVNGGIKVTSGTLTIVGHGTLVVNGKNGNKGAFGTNGYGGNGDTGGTAISGNIIVKGATVNANGGAGGTGGDTFYGYYAGDGGTGGAAFSGAVTIYSGTITAAAGNGGNGGHNDGEMYGGSGGTGGIAFTGTLTYYGGTVNANGGAGGNKGTGTVINYDGVNGNAGKAFDIDSSVNFQKTPTTLTNGSSTISQSEVTNHTTVNISGSGVVPQLPPTDASGAYLISSTYDWITFADAVNTGTTTFGGKTVKLTANISDVTTMVGTGDYPFAGTFDGDGHKLTVNISSSGAAALFIKVGNATIKNLHVAGSVKTTMTNGADHTGGLISRAGGSVTIENVRFSATVTGLTYYSGFIGNGNRDEVSIGTTIKMTGCVFDGQLTENVAGETQYAGGFIGWGGNMTITMTDCLFAGTSTIAASGSGARNFHPVGFHGTYNTSLGSLTLNNVYTTAPSATQYFPNYGAALSSGEKQAYSITAADANVTTLAISGNAVANYTVSGLKRYAAGIEYGSTFYAANGESVNLTLSHAAAAAVQHFTGYTVSGGGSFTEQTETSATLTMTAANQTISANYADNPAYEVVFANPSATAEGWSITPSGTVREGETVTVSYQGEHKVKSVVVSRAFKKAADATATDLGKLICTDGHIHADDGNTEDPDCTKERVAIIAYVGSDNGESAPYNHGLALAMSDASEYSQWSTLFSKAHPYSPSNSNSFTSESGLQYNALHNTDIDDYPAFQVAIANNGTVTPTGCSSWFLASAYQWVKMAAGVGGYNQLGLVESVGYWSSTEYTDSHSAWLFKSGDGTWENDLKESDYHVRACLAF